MSPPAVTASPQPRAEGSPGGCPYPPEPGQAAALGGTRSDSRRQEWRQLCVPSRRRPAAPPPGPQRCPRLRGAACPHSDDPPSRYSGCGAGPGSVLRQRRVGGGGAGGAPPASIHSLLSRSLLPPSLPPSVVRPSWPSQQVFPGSPLWARPSPGCREGGRRLVIQGVICFFITEKSGHLSRVCGSAALRTAGRMARHTDTQGTGEGFWLWRPWSSRLTQARGCRRPCSDPRSAQPAEAAAPGGHQQAAPVPVPAEDTPPHTVGWTQGPCHWTQTTGNGPSWCAQMRTGEDR